MLCFGKKKQYELKLHYSVQNGGDGSAYPEFFESAELARLDQENMDEGWAEDCDGTITLKSDSPITCDESITTLEDLIERMEEDWEYIIKYRDGDAERHLAILMNMKVDKDNV